MPGARSRGPVFTCSFQISFDLAEYTADVDGVGTLRLLDAVKTCGLINSVKFYQASTSELYGKVQEIPQKETTPFYPRSPYGEDAHGLGSLCSWGASAWTRLLAPGSWLRSRGVRAPLTQP